MAYSSLSQTRQNLGLKSISSSSSGYVPLDQARTTLFAANKAKVITPTPKPVVKPISKPIQTSPNLISQVQTKAAPIARAFDNPVLKTAKDVYTKIMSAGIKAADKQLGVSKKLGTLEKVGQKAGQALQKTPDLNLGTKGQKTFKATDTETKIVNFMSNFPSEILKSYGNDIEQIYTPAGREKLKKDALNLPKTMEQVKTHIDKREWMKALEAASSNSAIMVTLDAVALVPTGIVAKGTNLIRGKKVAQDLVKQTVEEASLQTAKKELKVVSAKKLGFKENVSNSAKPSDANAGLSDVEKRIKAIKPDANIQGIKQDVTQGSGFITSDGKFTNVNTGHNTLLGDLGEGEKGLNDYLNMGGIRTRVSQESGDINIEIHKAPTPQQLKTLLSLPDDRRYFYDVGDITQRGMSGTGTTKADFLKELDTKFSGILNKYEGDRGQSFKKPSQGSTPDKMPVVSDVRGMELGGRVQTERVPRGNRQTNNETSLRINPRVAQQTKGDIKPKIEAKTTTSLSGEKAVGESGGVVKTPSKIALSVKQKAVDQGITADLELAGYTKQTIKGESDKVMELAKDSEKFSRVLRGEEQSNINPLAIVKAAEDHIKNTGDLKMIQDLANSPLISESSKAAQIMRFAAEREPDSLAAKFQQIKKVREEAFKQRYGGKKLSEVRTKVVGDIKTKVKTPDKYDWSHFADSIQC